MANLSGYIEFFAKFEIDQLGSRIILTDNNDYPPGVDATFKGYFIITQPDGITITGNYTTPDIYWNGTILVDAVKELRLKTNGTFQNGTYTITYKIIAAGYNETTLTKSFDLVYTRPTAVIEKDFDVFTPLLKVIDNTDYNQTDLTWLGTEYAWSALIVKVESSTQTITATTTQFNLAYLGNYYDASYEVSLVDTFYYIIDAIYWITWIKDTITFNETYYAFIPPTIVQLLQLLTTYKAKVDDKSCICGGGCNCDCKDLKSTYALAVSIFSHIIERGLKNQTNNLGDYVLQLQKLLNNCVTPAYTNTNQLISPYDWGNNTTGSFVFYKQMVVGSGVNNAPVAGAIIYIDANLIGKTIVVYLDGLLMGTNLSDRVSIMFDTNTGTITWSTPLGLSQLISIYIV